MKFINTTFKDLYIIEPTVIGDNRGWFMRTFDDQLWKDNIPNFKSTWVQMNHSFNEDKGIWRGFHFQTPPHQESKVVRCISGSILDCVLDLRRDSNTFLQVFSIELNDENKKQLYIPKGFGHGFYTLKPKTEVLYLHDQYYNPAFEKGIKINDPILNYDLGHDIIKCSERDMNHELLNHTFKGY